MKALNDYFLGILYGDGYMQDDYYFFSTTRKGLADLVEEKLKSKEIKYSRYCRDYYGEEKNNWEQLEIIEIQDRAFFDWLELKKMYSTNPVDRLKNNSNFMRGYLETKGTFFYHKQRESDAWRLSFSGIQADIQYLHALCSNQLGINCSAIIQRKEREELNIVSQSFRFSIQNREGVGKFIDWIDDDYDITGFLKEKIIAFRDWDNSKPFNLMKSYKNAKTATQAMSRQLNIELKGKVGGGYGKAKPVYLWENDEPIQQFEGWQGAYEWAVGKFQEMGLIPPTIAD